MPRRISGKNDAVEYARRSYSSGSSVKKARKASSFERVVVALHLESVAVSVAEAWEKFRNYAFGKAKIDKKLKNVHLLHTNYLYRIWYSLKHFFKVLALSLWGLIRLVSPVVIPMAGVAIIVFSVWGVSTYSVGLKVTIGDQSVYVTSEEEFDRIRNQVQTEILTGGSGEYITEALPSKQMMMIPKNSFTSADEIADILSRNYEDYVGQSYGFFLDGVIIGTSRSGSDFDTLVDQLVEPYLTGTRGETYTVLNAVETVRDAYPSSYDRSYDELKALFTTSPDKTQYKVKKGDTAAGIADKYGLNVPVLKLLNENVNFDSLSVGTVLNVGKPYYELRVQTVTTVTYSEIIPYETKYVKTDTLYEGVTQTKQKGSNGSYEVTAEVRTVNGVEVSREVVGKKKVKDAINRRILVGTKTIAPSGYFIFPLDRSGFYRVSSHFGWRTLRGKPDFHNALDLAAEYGTKIYAADSGTVYKKGWQENGLGNYIAIDHGNGIVSYYGHCSKLVKDLKVGDKVYQGQVIAYVGSTGNSTGNHLHFALYNKEDKAYFDPEPYVKIK